MSIPNDDPDLRRRLAALYAEADLRFDALARAAGLDPATDFRARDLRALRFADADLGGFDLSDSDLRGTGLRFARHVDTTTRLDGAILDDDDAGWLAARSRDVDEDRAVLERDLRRAIDRQQFALVFQPKVGLKGGTIIGVEALLRWQHSERGNVHPATFVPLLEEMDLIETVTYWTIEAAIDQQRNLRARGFDIPVSLNISPMILGRRDFLANCRRILEGARARLRFEISETALVTQYDAARNQIAELASMGVTIAIDDYGAGLSSLALLKDSGARELKIDRSFINRLDKGQSDPLIVRSTIDLGHALEMEVTADGVETASQLALLTVMGCDAAQGFVISRALPLADLSDFLDANAAIDIPKAPGTTADRQDVG